MKKRRKGSSAKARERLHALRMKFKAGYAEQYWKGLGFDTGEIRGLRSKHGVRT